MKTFFFNERQACEKKKSHGDHDIASVYQRLHQPLHKSRQTGAWNERPRFLLDSSAVFGVHLRCLLSPYQMRGSAIL